MSTAFPALLSGCPPTGFAAGLACDPAVADAAGVWPAAGVAAVFGVCLAALGALASTALLVYSPTKLQKQLRGNSALRFERWREREADLIATARALTVLGATLGIAASAGMGGPLPAWGNVLIAMVTLLVFMAGLPPALATTRSEAVVARTLPVIAAMHALLRFPVVIPMRAAARAILQVARVPEQPTEDPDEIADEILAAVSDSDRSNALEDEEKSWIANIVDLGDLQASGIMTPRTDVVALHADLPLDKALTEITETGHSRYPVHAGQLDEVVGVFYAKDALARLASGKELAGVRVRDLMRKPLFVPDTMGVADLLRLLRQAKVHLAVVLDEYGGTSGIITVKDILEEIVGDIADEYGADEDQPLLRVLDEPGTLEASGRTRVNDLNEHLADHELPEHDDYDTIAGYVFSQLGRIPSVGETFVSDGIQFTVLRGDARHLGRLRLRLLHPQTSDSPAG